MPTRWLILATLLSLAGCNDPGQRSTQDIAVQRVGGSAPMAMEAAPAMAEADQSSPENRPRYLAERQFWAFELPEADIEARWQAHMNLCRQDCEVLNAGLHKSAHAPVNASLQIRVARARAATLLNAMDSPEVIERRVEREDKTLHVVDVEARMKNLADLRDRLRLLLAKRDGSLKDVLETERELARVQADLDAMTAQRLALANETEKILLYADYRPRPTLTETGFLQPLAEAWHGAGRAFAESLAAALLFLVQALPWLVLVLPAMWGLWKGVRRLLNGRRKLRPDQPT